MDFKLKRTCELPTHGAIGIGNVIQAYRATKLREGWLQLTPFCLFARFVKKKKKLLTPRSLSKLARAEAKGVGHKRDKSFWSRINQGFIEIKQVEKDERFTQQYQNDCRN